MVTTKGCARLTIQLPDNSLNIEHDFHIVGPSFSIPADGLLGNDFLLKERAKLDFENNVLLIRGLSIPFYEPAWENVISLPPRSESIQEVRYIQPTDALPDSIYFIERAQLTECVTCPHAVVSPRDGKCYVALLNVSEEPQTLIVPTLALQDIVLEEPRSSVSDQHVLSIQHSSSSRLKEIEVRSHLDSLNPEEMQSILKLIHEFNDLYLLPGDKLSTIPNITHRIITKTDEPINVRPYRIPHAYKKEVDRQLEEMKAQNIITESDSPYNFPLLVVPKKPGPDGKRGLRICVDFRRLNEVSLGQSYPIPNISDILDCLSNSRYFSTIDLASAFWQIKMEKSDAHKTAFSSGFSKYHFLRCPFGLANAPSTMARVMSNVLGSVKGLRAFAYLDDVIVYSPDLKRHEDDLRTLFTAMRKFNLKIQPEKCAYFRKEVVYLGHHISEKGILPDESKIQVLKTMSPPKNLKEVKSFIAFCSYYRKFVKNFAQIALPLTKLTKKDVHFRWTSQEQAAFEQLIHCLTNPPVLQFPDFTKTFNISPDASLFSIGAILSQGPIGKDLPIAYASKTLSKAESNWSVTDRECYSIIYALRHFHPYVYGRRVKIFSDHRPLTWLFKNKNLNSRLFRWSLEIGQYDYEIIYRKGANNPADHLSRIISVNKDEVENCEGRAEAEMQCQVSQASGDPTVNIPDPVNFADPYQQFLKLQETRVIMNPLVQEIAQDIKAAVRSSNIDSVVFFITKDLVGIQHIPYPSAVENLKSRSTIDTITRVPLQKLCVLFVAYKERISEPLNGQRLFTTITTLKNELLKSSSQRILIQEIPDPIESQQFRVMVRHIFINSPFRVTLVPYRVITILDPSQRELIIKQYHGNLIHGHEGMNRTYKKLKARFRWEHMKEQVEDFVKKCPECQINKTRTQRNTKVPMQISFTPYEPFQKLNVDLMGPLPLSIHGNRYILSAQCDLTKYNIAIPLPNQESETIARALVKEIFLIYGSPRYILTDLGSNFVGQLIQDLCKLFKIKKLQTTAFHPQANGSVEKSHQLFTNYLKHFINTNQDNWCELLPFASFAINTNVHTGTKHVPFELVFGRQAAIPSASHQPPPFTYNYDDYLMELRQRLHLSHKEARDHLEKSKAIYKHYYDRTLKPVNFNVGDQVLLQNEQVKKGTSRKLTPSWLGPFLVEAVEGVNVVIKIGRKTQKVHMNRLKKYFQ